MKRMLHVVTLVIMAHSVTAWADRGDQYLLPKFGIMTVNLNNADNLYSLGVLYGYGLTPEVSVEGEVNLSLTGGDYKRKDATGSVIESGKYKVWTVAGYGVYRYPFTETAYLKGKLGLLYENVDRSANIGEGHTAKAFGVAGGIGAGILIRGNLTIEAEITGIDKDIIFYSLGVHYPF